MGPVRIAEVAERYGISSRTLRYYEGMGILWSIHPDNKAQRHYDDAALERLRQILVLRKLQISVKDIAAIYGSEDTAALIRAFVDKLDALDAEISALTELRRLVDEFLHAMLLSGIRRMSALPLLYEEAEKRLATAGRCDGITWERLSKVGRDALRLHDVRILRLPPMRVLTSRRRTGQAESLDGGNMQNLFAAHGFLPDPGMRNCLYRREPGDEWIMLMRIPNDYDNATAYIDEMLPGGLYAVASSFMEDMDDTFALLKAWIERSAPYAIDGDGGARCDMIEEILPWDIAARYDRYQQDVFVPIRIVDDETA